METRDVVVPICTVLGGAYREEIKAFVNRRLAKFWAARQEDMAQLKTFREGGRSDISLDPEWREMKDTLGWLVALLAFAALGRWQGWYVVQALSSGLFAGAFVRHMLVLSVLRLYGLALTLEARRD